MSKYSRTSRAFEADNPGFYRLSQDLQNYHYPPYLGIQSVELCPSGDALYTCVDWSVDVLVTIDDIEHRIHVSTPLALCHGFTVQATPMNCVVVPTIDGASLAWAISVIARQGLENPSDADLLCARLIQELGEDGDDLYDCFKGRPTEAELADRLTDLGAKEPKLLAREFLTLWPNPKPLPKAWETLKGEIREVLSQCEPASDKTDFRRLLGSVMGRVSRKPYVQAIDVVEILLHHDLELSRQQLHALADEVLARCQEYAHLIFPYRLDVA